MSFALVEFCMEKIYFLFSIPSFERSPVLFDLEFGFSPHSFFHLGMETCFRINRFLFLTKNFVLKFVFNLYSFTFLLHL